MAVFASVSPSPVIASAPTLRKAPATALGAGTKSGSTQPARAMPSHTMSSAATLTTCSSRIRSVIGAGPARPPRSEGGPSEMAVASIGPSAGALLDDAGDGVGGDDQQKRDDHEGDVVGGAEQTVGVIDERAHAGRRAEHLADDDADHRERQSGAQPADEREQHRG